jgi:uncharacterized protein
MTSSTIGYVASLWRYPVKSMMGEELNATDIAENGIVGDRAYALIDRETGKVASAKNPRRWQNLFDFRATYITTPKAGEPLPIVKISLPDGTQIISNGNETNKILSQAVGREVVLESNALIEPILEEYWLDLEGQPHRETVTDEATLSNTFFDLATVHLLTTATMGKLQDLSPTGRFEAKRFRPNLVIAPAEEEIDFIENEWIEKIIEIGDEVRLSITGPCPRCVMTTLPQGDLPRDANILKTSLQHNQGHVGVYASVLQGGTVRRGDALKVR